MNIIFARALSQLRHEKGVSQRQASRELGVSQALLSHYENGIREPGLAFVVRACNYYKVSADYLLGRTCERAGIGGTGSGSQPDNAALMRTADTFSQACLDLCKKDPRMDLLFRRMVGRLMKDLEEEPSR